MTTTLSDEEFQRLNNQLLELKVQNYNLEASLSKTVIECNSVKTENEQLRKQIDSLGNQSKAATGRTDGQTHVQSIKQKLNPFALAKNIANKVNATAHGQPIATANESGNENNLQSPNSQIELAQRLQLQESEFFKINDTLKGEISLLQSQLEQSEASNRQLQEEINRLANVQNENHSESQTYSPSKQLQLSLQVLATSIGNQQQNASTNFVKLIESFISAVHENQNVKPAIDAITSVFDQKGIKDEDLMNTTEDFKQICKFFDSTHQYQLADAKQLLTQLCNSFVDYERQQCDVQQIKLATMLANEMAPMNAKIKQLQTYKQKTENGLRGICSRLEELKAAKQSLDKAIAQMAADNAEMQKRFWDESTNIIESQLKLQSEQYKRSLKEAAELQQATQLQLEEAKQEIESLNGKINESINEHKISEKRGFKIIKELKKQLNTEKNRADKLQGILNSEAEMNESGAKSMHNSPNARHSAEALAVATSDKGSSSGSWSYMNETPGAISLTAKPRLDSVHSEFSDIEIVNSLQKGDSTAASTADNTAACTGANVIHSSLNVKKKPRGTSINSISFGTLEQDNAQLVARVSNLQQEKWRLEEQVNQLEHEISRLAAELAEKTRLIQHYCIEGRVDMRLHESLPISPTLHQHSRTQIGRLGSTSSTLSSSGKQAASLNNSVLRVVTFLKEKSELVTNAESAKQMAEVNCSLKRMVEEILTKNMHLQSNLEEMSDQLMDIKARLRKYEEP